MDLLSDRKVCNMALAQFSRDDMLREEGQTIQAEESAIAMLRDNLALDKIVLYSGLSMSRVLELQKTLN